MKKQITKTLAAITAISLLAPLAACNKKAGPIGDPTSDAANSETEIVHSCDDDESWDSGAAGSANSTLSGTPNPTPTPTPTPSAPATTRALPDLPTGDETFNRIVPTGTIVDSDHPEMPSDVVYLDPSRNLKSEYTLEEASSKYAIKLNRSTLICTACDSLKMSHNFYCSDFGAGRYWLRNFIYFLDENGRIIDTLVNHGELEDSLYGSLDKFEENLESVHCDSWSLRSPASRPGPDQEFNISILDRTDDYLFAQVNSNLYYARVIRGRICYLYYDTNPAYDEAPTDKDRENFRKYAGILFEHLSGDDRTEPYIYDKLVNIPLFGNYHLTSFNTVGSVSRTNIYIRTETALDDFSVIIDPDDSNIAPDTYYTNWSDLGDMKVRDDRNGHRELLFTISDVTYLCTIQKNEDIKSTSEFLDILIDGGVIS